MYGGLMQLVAWLSMAAPDHRPVLYSYEQFEEYSAHEIDFDSFSELDPNISYLDCYKIYMHVVKAGMFHECKDEYVFIEVLVRAYYFIRMTRRIRNWWTHIYYSPETEVGRRRLEREVEGLIEQGIVSN